MKIKDILSKLDLSKQKEYYLDENFLYEFDDSTYYHEIDHDKSQFKEIWLICWYCTDSWVGTKVILLNDIPLCLSNQDARKSDEDFEWFSKECFELARTHIKEIKIQKEEKDNYSLADLEYDFDDDYSIQFPDQLMIRQFHSFGFYENQKVTIEKIQRKPSEYNSDAVKIIFELGETKIIDVSEIKFPLLGLKE